jgi:hypothetical protein
MNPSPARSVGEVGEPHSGSPGGGQGPPRAQHVGLWHGAAPTLPSPTLRAGEGFLTDWRGHDGLKEG